MTEPVIDWRVGAGQVDATTSFNTFEAILGNATTLSTGYVERCDDTTRVVNDVVFRFIVLQHDLFEVTVDIAIGYTLNAASTHQPPFSVSV
jgi:hypothetical protein